MDSQCRCGLAALGLALALLSQPNAAQQPRFSTRVDVVTLDVTVLDRQRRSVGGLAADDMVLLDNGVPQAIQTFAEVEVPGGTPGSVGLASDVASNDHRSHRLFVIVIDDGTLPFKPRYMRDVRNAARDFVHRLGAYDLTAVVFTRDNRHAQDFTQDKSLLLAAIDRTSYPPAGSLYYDLSSIDTLGRIAESLESIPGRRKAIAYVSVGVRLDTDMVSQVTMAAPNQSMLESESQISMMRALRRTIDRAQRANVAIYPLDPSGVMGVDPHPARARMYWEYLQVLADHTGGKATIKTNDLIPGVERIFNETRVYYLLGYVPAPPGRPGAYRRVEVKVKTPGLEATTRKGYFTSRQESPETAPSVSPELRSISGILANSGIPLKGTATAFPDADGGPALAVTLAVDRTGLPEGAGTLQILTHVFDPEGRLKNAYEQSASICDTEETCEVAMRIPITPGRHALRISVQHTASGVTGSVYLNAVVPNFKRGAATLSGLAVSSLSKPVPMSDGGLRALLPVTPTTRRYFARSEDATVFFRIHQDRGPRPSAVTRTVSITDVSGASVWESTETLGAEVFLSSHGLDQVIALPLASLAAGRYEFRVRLGRATGVENERALSFWVQ